MRVQARLGSGVGPPDPNVLMMLEVAVLLRQSEHRDPVGDFVPVL